MQQLKKFSGYYSPSISEGPKNKSNRVSSVEETVLRICYIEECIKSQIAELTALLSKIRSVIERVNNLEYETILEMRYLSFMKWEEIAIRMDFSLVYVYKIHAKALAIIDSQLNR